MHSLTAVLCAGLTLVFFYKTTSACANNTKAYAMNSIFFWLFNSMATVFLIDGILMIHYLKKYYVQFYEEYRWALIIATGLLSAPLYVRGINSLLMNREKVYYHFYNNHFASVNSTYVAISSTIPTVAQLASMIFGVV